MADDIQKVLDELSDNGAYVAQDFKSHCTVCDKLKDLRLGVCFNCADAESIIGEGLDMYDRGIGGSKIPATNAIDKLQILIQKGWKFDE